jgi:hypothetical protein
MKAVINTLSSDSGWLQARPSQPPIRYVLGAHNALSQLHVVLKLMCGALSPRHLYTFTTWYVDTGILTFTLLSIAWVK